MFWGGAVPIRGERYTALRALLESDTAVYSAHLPLDRHVEFGNGVLFAGGSFTNASGVPANNIAQFDGSTWAPVGEGR